MGAQKNRLLKTVLLTTHNICFGLEIRKMILKYALLSEGMVSVRAICIAGSEGFKQIHIIINIILDNSKPMSVLNFDTLETN